MKRILLSVFAAAITAAWAVPAGAADATFGGEYRVRGEYRNNADFDDTSTSNDHRDYIGQRVRLTGNLKATEDTSFKITLQDTRVWGDTALAAGGPNLTDDEVTFDATGLITSSTGTNKLDLHESYMNVDNLFGAPVTLRVGRQELSYGDQRLVGSFGWSNNGRSFDAAKVVVNTDIANIDIFASKIREGVTSSNDQNFYGLYLTTKAIPNNSLDLYALALTDQAHGGTQTPFGFGSTVGNHGIAAGIVNESQHLYTVGARIKGAVAGLDYTVEVPFQFGDINTTGTDYDISAYALAAKVGYTLPTPIKVRIGAEYDFATGDDSSTDDTIDTFFNLFPTNHDKLGYMDQQGWRNVSAWNVNALVDVNEKVSIFASYWNFSLAEEQDAWYGAGQWNNSPTSGLRAASSTNADDEIGSEIDLVAKYKYNNNVTAELGVSRFFAGDFIKNDATTVDDADQDFAYLMLTANF